MENFKNIFEKVLRFQNKLYICVRKGDKPITIKLSKMKTVFFLIASIILIFGLFKVVVGDVKKSNIDRHFGSDTVTFHTPYDVYQLNRPGSEREWQIIDSLNNSLK